MIKARIKYLTILCILLLSVSGQLVANTPCSSASHQQVKNPESSESFNAGIQQGNFTFISPSFVFNNQESLLFESDEKFEEDDKENIVSQKKNVENSYNLSPLFNNNYTKLLFLKNPQTLHFSKHFLLIPFHKLFMVFRVFRI